MVTKLISVNSVPAFGFCSSKNPYGNKTDYDKISVTSKFCSSKNPYVTKRTFGTIEKQMGSVLAKILMVTKLES